MIVLGLLHCTLVSALLTLQFSTLFLSLSYKRNKSVLYYCALLQHTLVSAQLTLPLSTSVPYTLSQSYLALLQHTLMSAQLTSRLSTSVSYTLSQSYLALLKQNTLVSAQLSLPLSTSVIIIIIIPDLYSALFIQDADTNTFCNTVSKEIDQSYSIIL